MILTKKRGWAKVPRVPRVWFIGFFAVLLNQTAYVYAVKSVPVEQAEILYYLWPTMVVLVTYFFMETESSFVPLISAGIGMVGIYIMITDGKGFGSVSLENSAGYFFAVLSGGAWVVYSLFNRYNPHIPVEMNGMWCGLSAIPCAILSLLYEEMIMPTMYDWMLLLFIGIVTLTFSFWMWSRGVQSGHFNFLSVVSYATPLLSVIFLIVFEKVEFKANVIVACQLVILGGTLCSIVEWLQSKVAGVRADPD